MNEIKTVITDTKGTNEQRKRRYRVCNLKRSEGKEDDYGEREKIREEMMEFLCHQILSLVSNKCSLFSSHLLSFQF